MSGEVEAGESAREQNQDGTFELEGAVAVVDLSDATGRNALSEDVVNRLFATFEAVAKDSRVRAVVLVGGGEVFCSGASRELLERLLRREAVPSDIKLAKALLDVPIPTIAAMEGHAVGGGFALGLCADLVLVARESRYGANFMNMGITPGMGMTRLLEHVLSPAMAHELLFTGELKRGSEFERTGINYVLPRAEVRARAMDLAARIAEKPRAALEVLKRVLSVKRRQAFEETYTLETLMHTITLAEPETRSMLEDAYVD